MASKALNAYNPFARRLQQWMRAQDPPRSDAQFAAFLGIAKQTVSNWMTGKSFPQHAARVLISQYTGISYDELDQLIRLAMSQATLRTTEALVTWARAALPGWQMSDATREDVTTTLDTMESAAWRASRGPWRVVAQYVLDSGAANVEKIMQLTVIVKAYLHDRHRDVPLDFPETSAS